jgi:hypothetical protein
MSMEVKINTLRRFKNLIGERFGKLVVISGPLNITEESEWRKKQRKWLCKCDCGNEVIRITNQLNKIPMPNCGCFSKKRMVELNTKNCRPFEWIYNNLSRCARHNNKEMILSFDDFLAFTKINRCHYCGDKITWRDRNSKKKPDSCYYIDRKDNAKGYIKENCVVCCSLCNFTKHSHFSYDEMLLLGKTIGAIKKSRQATEPNGFVEIVKCQAAKGATTALGSTAITGAEGAIA